MNTGFTVNVGNSTNKLGEYLLDFVCRERAMTEEIVI